MVKRAMTRQEEIRNDYLVSKGFDDKREWTQFQCFSNPSRKAHSGQNRTVNPYLAKKMLEEQRKERERDALIALRKELEKAMVTVG